MRKAPWLLQQWEKDGTIPAYTAYVAEEASMWRIQQIQLAGSRGQATARAPAAVRTARAEPRESAQPTASLQASKLARQEAET
jgi:hypothetical protein